MPLSDNKTNVRVIHTFTEFPLIISELFRFIICVVFNLFALPLFQLGMSLLFPPIPPTLLALTFLIRSFTRLDCFFYSDFLFPPSNLAFNFFWTLFLFNILFFGSSIPLKYFEAFINIST